ncbi:Fatty acid metabolism regulator protein [Streptomyces malaysiensis subsp. malaysiensis]|uniref:TetR/AcrR family transcriptional regulator n=1 Tax=Streptomyces malaysiensis TaxID=92644 RepID=UPI000CA2A373|nr:Fatty acid metabolism regulator protein [Streptomyces sp. M56]
MPKATAPQPERGPGLGLRERKKIKTRQAIRRAALRLFAEQGYEATPVDRIARAADVSSSTVFRYFPAKEDIVLTDEYDGLMAEAIRERPRDEPPAASLRHAVAELLGPSAGAERDELLARLALVRQVPALRARMSGCLADSGALLGEALAERSGRAPDDFEVRVAVGAVLGALREAVFHCLDHGLARGLDESLGDGLGESLDHGPKGTAGTKEPKTPKTQGTPGTPGTPGRPSGAPRATRRGADDLATAIDRALNLLSRGVPL